MIYIPDYTFVCHRTALSLAAQLGHSDSVRALIAAGADVNQMDARLCTALCYAAQVGQSECIKLLIESEADVNRDVCVEMPHLMKSQHDHEYKRSALMRLYYPESSVQRQFEQSYYHLTEERYKAFSRNPNREQCLEILLEAGAEVNIVDTRGHTLLTHLAKQPDTRYHVKKLLDAGADVNLAGPSGKSPLLSALSVNAEKTLDLLLKAGADVNTPTAIVYTMARFANSRCAKLLFQAGVRIHTSQMVLREEVINEFHAVGSRIPDSQMPPYVKEEDEERRLKHLCRVGIRNHLLQLDPHENLFVRVPRLGLPKSLATYLLYDVTVDDVNDDNDNDIE